MAASSKTPLHQSKDPQNSKPRSKCQFSQGAVRCVIIPKRLDGSGLPRATADRVDRLTVRSAVTAPDSLLLTIRREARTRVSTIAVHRQLIEQNLRLYRPLCHLPLTPAHCRARLQWCLARSGGNHDD
ncbi:HTH_Tnp_Tc3_2 domain-containing protein [Trichonephila clavipes]|nr:HTH_Tnp_Tc3_2 domain-containing protein [Trichonephila clavipes]